MRETIPTDRPFLTIRSKNPKGMGRDLELTVLESWRANITLHRLKVTLTC
jgi:hypothetical protein